MLRDKIFISYSHKDNDFLNKVKRHLKVLENEGLKINYWDDTKIKAGMLWKTEIENALENTKVAILLVSTDFLVSDFITKNELPPLLEAVEKEGAIIIPLIIKPCRFMKHPKLGHYQSVNNPSKPLSALNDNDQEIELLNFADRIAELVS